MRKLTILLFLMSYTLFYGQMGPAKVVLKSGDTIFGYANMVGANLKFKYTKDAKPSKRHLSQFEKVIIEHSESVTLTYMYLKVPIWNNPVIVNERITGSVILYARVAPSSQYTIMNYFVKRIEDTSITHIGSTQGSQKAFRLKATTFFKDCPLLVEKINNKEFRIRKLEDMEKVVRFYNNECKL